MIHFFGLTRKSSNKKCEGMAVSRHSRSTCPPQCPMAKDGTCFGRFGPCRWHWMALEEGKGLAWGSFIEQVRTLPPGLPFRGCEVGDQVPAAPGIVDKAKMFELAKAVGDRVAWTYSHYLASGSSLIADANRTAFRLSNKMGLIVRCSTESKTEALDLVKHGMKAFLVVPSEYHRKTKKAGKGVEWDESLPEYWARRKTIPALPGPLCPAAYTEMKCIDCEACATGADLLCNPAHGTAKKRLDARLRRTA